MYNQIDLIPAGTARRDALRLTKRKAKLLPRVTAYATAGYGLVTLMRAIFLLIVLVQFTSRSYKFPELLRFFNARRASYHTNPRVIDEVIYTPYVYESPLSSSSDRQSSTIQSPQNHTADLLGVPELAPVNSEGGNGAKEGKRRKGKFLQVEPPRQAEIFMFQYGTVVIWGMTEAQEKRFLSSMYVLLLDSYRGYPSHVLKIRD